MKDTILETEKFDTLKELAELQSTISTGRAELMQIKEDTEQYMVLREKDAEQRILEVLKKSRASLEETAKNHDELSAYSKEVKAYANKIKALSTDFTTLFQDFKEEINTADDLMVEREKQVSENLKLTKLETIQVREDRKMMAREKDTIRLEWVLLKDRQKTLKEGFEELKTKQN